MPSIPLNPSPGPINPASVIRINNFVWSFHSVRLTFDGFPVDGFVGIDYDEQRETRQIGSNSADSLLIGMGRGKYKIEAFPLRMLRDSAQAFKVYLTAKAAIQAATNPGTGTSVSDATFELGLQLSGFDSADMVPSTTTFFSCRVLGEKRVHQEGIDELVSEFRIGCLGADQDGTSLWNVVAGTSSDPFPGVDSITINNVQMVGKWTLQPGKKVYGWEIRKGTYLTGATVVPTGDDLMEPEFLVEIWDPNDYAEFVLQRFALLSKGVVGLPGLPSVALGIDHPELTLLGCSAVVVKECPWLTNDGFGVWTGTVKFLQYLPPLPAIGPPSSATPAVVAPVPTATTEGEVALQAEQARLAAMPP